MPNDTARAEYWSAFIGSHCHYPAPERLRAQLAIAVFSDFCRCGCNSFAVTIPATADVPPLARPGGRSGMIFSANFHLPCDQTLEVALFADPAGNLDYVEVQCCANASPVPEVISIEGPPYQVWASENLLV